ncbi:hypothetical protein [Hymenobacter antarcticus]|uniref:Uncharacterized protein n=1 Tax=Hymenobacter antarcticus TaxID=486270 RepID=A0ABP7PQH6_9BACT
MLRPLRIVKPERLTEEDRQAREEVLNAPVPPGLPPGTNMLLVSVAGRFRGRGLNLTELVEAGKEGWQRAQRHYGAETDKLEQWGLRWVQESMLIALYDNENKAGL